MLRCRQIEFRVSKQALWECLKRALGLTIIIFNLEARQLPGKDAVVLKEVTDALIREACAYPEPQPLREGRAERKDQAANVLNAAR